LGAKIKMPDLNCFDIEAAMNPAKGTARSIGVDGRLTQVRHGTM
jgi:ribosomal protein L11